MTDNLLTLAMRLARRLPLSTEPTQVVGSTDPGIRQILEIMQEEGDELAKRHSWSVLLKDWTITLLANPHTEAFPTDYGRLRPNAYFWRSGSSLTPLSGPTPPSAWQYLTNVAGTYPGYYRLFGGTFQILGVAITETVSGQYVSKNWVLDTDGTTTKASWAADTDTPLLDGSLILIGSRWRWKQSKGLEYGEDMETYERAVERAIADDRAATPASMGRWMRGDQPPSTWPGTITVP